jgi:hypothetical protein
MHFMDDHSALEWQKSGPEPSNSAERFFFRGNFMLFVLGNKLTAAANVIALQSSNPVIRTPALSRVFF